MKKVNLYILLAALISGNLFSGNAIYSQWIISATLPGLTGRPAVSIGDENSAWAVAGPDGSPGIPVIYKTTNGGVSWAGVQTTGIQTNLICVAAKSSEVAFVGDIDSPDGYGRFYKTTNGGTSWNTVDSVFNNGVSGCTNIIFAASDTLFGVALLRGLGDTVFIFKTYDGGNIWVKSFMTLPSGSGLPISSLTVIDTYFYCFGTNGGTPSVNYTSDGGFTWNNSQLGVPASTFLRGTAFSVNKMTGVASGLLPDIARTTNGGQNWSVINTGLGAGTTVMRWVNGTNTIYMTSQSSSSSAIYKSTDAGFSWFGMTSPFSDAFNIDIKRIRDMIYGYAVSGNQVIKLVEDAGILDGKRFFADCIAPTPKLFTKGNLTLTGSHTTFGPGTSVNYTAMDFDNTNKLYCIPGEVDPQLSLLDTSTGNLTQLGAITGLVSSSHSIFRMAFNPANNQMYMTSRHNDTIATYLYTLNLNTRVAEVIGLLDFNPTDLAIDASGNCYAILAVNLLAKINLSDAGYELINSLDYNNGNQTQGICFDNQTGVLFITAWNNDSMRVELRSIDILTAKTTLWARFNPQLGRMVGLCMPNSTMVGITNISSTIPSGYTLGQNYPNPFNPVTNLEFGISRFGFVSLKVYDILGKEVATLINSKLTPGIYKYNFDGSNFSSGVYFYKLDADGFVDTKKMFLLK